MDVNRLKILKLLVSYFCAHLILIPNSPSQIALSFSYIVPI